MNDPNAPRKERAMVLDVTMSNVHTGFIVTALVNGRNISLVYVFNPLQKDACREQYAQLTSKVMLCIDVEGADINQDNMFVHKWSIVTGVPGLTEPLIPTHQEKLEAIAMEAMITSGKSFDLLAEEARCAQIDRETPDMP